MADWFKARFLAQADKENEEQFQHLVDILQEAVDGDGIFDIESLEYFDSRTMCDANDTPEIREGEVEFSLIIPYGIDKEGLRDFTKDFGIKRIYCLYAHERDELQDWECNDEEHKTIGILLTEKKIDEFGDEYCSQNFTYPPEDDQIKIGQYFRLAWHGSWTKEGSFEEFFSQNGDELARLVNDGIRVKEYADDEEGRDMTLREILGLDPVDASDGFLGDKKNWWAKV